MSVSLVFLLVSCFQNTQESPTYYEEFKVSVHQLHVTVVDKDRNPVKGLTKEDFVVLIDGKEQSVDSVFPVSLDIYEGTESRERLPEHARRLFVFVFDMEYTTPVGLIKARADVLDFIENDMRSHDLGCVFTMSSRNIRMVTNFTSDKKQLLNAVTTFGFGVEDQTFHKTTGYALGSNVKDADGVSAKEAMDGLGKETIKPTETLDIGDPSGKWDSPVIYIYQRLTELKRTSDTGAVTNYLTNFKQFAEMLRVIEGRKNLILFSSGYSGDLAVGERFTLDSDAFASGEIISSSHVLVQALQGSGVVVYAVDTSYDRGTSGQKSSLHSLNDLSSSTGGRLYANETNFDHILDDIKTTTNDYYLVNFRSEMDIPKDEASKVKVRVNRPKTKVFTSKNLVLNPDFANYGDVERKLMLTDYIAKDIVSLSIPIENYMIRLPETAPAEGESSGPISLCTILKVEGDYFLSSKYANKPMDFDAMVVVLDPDGNVQIEQKYRNFRIIPNKAKEVFSKTGLKYISMLSLKPGQYKIKSIFRNLVTGETAAIIKEINLSEEGEPVSMPLRITQDPWLVMQDEETESNDSSYPFSFGKTRFVPDFPRAWTPGETVQLLYLLDPEAINPEKGAPTLAAVLVDAQGEYVVAPPDSLRSYVYEAGAPNKPAGILLSMETTSLDLKFGESYKLLTRISVGQEEPMLFETPFSIAEKVNSN